MIIRGENHVLYFGYGAHASPKLMEVLLGRKVYGSMARIKNQGIFVNSWNNISKQVQGELSESWKPKDNFRSYGLKTKRGSCVVGKLWRISSEERDVILRWNIADEGWYSPLKLPIEDDGGQEIIAETETMMSPSSSIFYVDGSDYKYFLNSRTKMLSVAEKVRTRIELS